MNLWNLFGRGRSDGSTSVPAENPGETERESAAGEPHHVLGERGITPINRSHSLQSRLSNLLAMGLMLSLGLGLLAWYYTHALSRQSRVREQAAAATRAKVQADMPLPALGPITPPPSEPLPLIERLLGPAPGLTALAAPHPAGTGRSSARQAADRRLAGAVFTPASPYVGSGGEGPAVSSGAPVRTAAAMPVSSEEGESRAPGADVAALLTPSVTPAVQARVLPTETLLMPKGAFIDCTLETAIDSSLPGLATCITATDTFGADGKVVLLERGTKLVGETRGEVQQGTSRVFVLWSEVRTPTGVVVPLASPGTDELGRSGLPGATNRHFLERFGAAMLISVIDGAVQAAVTAQSRGGGVIYDPAASEDVMTGILKGTVNIPPTVVKQNGDRIQVLVARDLDFRSVYELRTLARPH